jgi:hypothetical protein
VSERSDFFWMVEGALESQMAKPNKMTIYWKALKHAEKHFLKCHDILNLGEIYIFLKKVISGTGKIKSISTNMYKLMSS